MAKPSRAPLTVNGTSSINGEANGKVSTLPRQTKLNQFIECHRPFAGNRNNERIKWKSIEPNKQSAELISCIFINMQMKANNNKWNEYFPNWTDRLFRGVCVSHVRIV